MSDVTLSSELVLGPTTTAIASVPVPVAIALERKTPDGGVFEYDRAWFVQIEASSSDHNTAALLLCVQ